MWRLHKIVYWQHTRRTISKNSKARFGRVFFLILLYFIWPFDFHRSISYRAFDWIARGKRTRREFFFEKECVCVGGWVASGKETRTGFVLALESRQSDFILRFLFSPRRVCSAKIGTVKNFFCSFCRFAPPCKVDIKQGRPDAIRIPRRL